MIKTPYTNCIVKQTTLPLLTESNPSTMKVSENERAQERLISRIGINNEIFSDVYIALVLLVGYLIARYESNFTWARWTLALSILIGDTSIIMLVLLPYPSKAIAAIAPSFVPQETTTDTSADRRHETSFEKSFDNTKQTTVYTSVSQGNVLFRV
jgi:hypothetical protein